MGTDNRHVKFGPKIPNRLGKNVRKSQGGIFLTHTVVTVVVVKRCTLLFVGRPQSYTGRQSSSSIHRTRKLLCYHTVVQ